MFLKVNLEYIMKKLLGIAIAVLCLAPMAMSANLAVNIQGNAYDPALVVVTVGDTVTWTNNDAVLHTVTGSGSFTSGDISSGGGTWSYVFDTPGKFDYTCDYHPAMEGTVFVNVYTIPTMTTYGLALLALLLIVSSVYVIRRKKASAVA